MVGKQLTASFTRKSFKDLEDKLFPQCECPFTALGAGVIVQVASPLDKSDGGIILIDDIKDHQKWTQNFGRVVEIGPVAYKNRDTLEPWPEGPWCKVGDFVHIPLYTGHRQEVRLEDGRVALFATVQDRTIQNGIKPSFDPLHLKPWAY